MGLDRAGRAAATGGTPPENSGSPPAGEVFSFGMHEIDLVRFELRRGGRVVALEPKVFDLLAVLLRRRDRVVTKDELLEALWGSTHVSESSLTRCVSLARKALDDRRSAPAVIQTVHGRGYRFVAPATPPAAIAALDFVGRDEEIAALARALEDASAGSGRVLLFSGEAGIGKTRLLEEFLRMARAAGAQAHIGRCVEGDGAPPFWPWRQVLRSALERRGKAERRTLLGPEGPELSLIVPEVVDGARGTAPALVAEQERFRLFESVSAVLERLAHRAPLVIALDDVHRADEPSLALLRFLAAALADHRVLLLATSRPGDRGGSAARRRILTGLARDPQVRAFGLQGLRSSAIELLVRATVPAAADDLTNRIHAQTNGNPFFIAQLLPLLVDPDGARDIDPRRLPRTVQAAVARQVDELSLACQRLLRVAAVIGREFSLAVLAAATKLSRNRLEGLIGEAARAGIVAVEPSRYRFAHMLVRDCLYEQLSEGERASGHARVADALASFGGGASDDAQVSEIATHAYLGLPAMPALKVISTAMRAGRVASERFAYEEASLHFARAVELLCQRDGHDSERCDALLALGEAQIRAGNRASGVATFRRAASVARTIGASALLARAALGVCPGYFAIESGVYDAVLVRLLEEALAAVPAEEPALRARLLARRSVALYWSPKAEQRGRAAAEALAIAGGLEDERARAEVQVAAIVATWGPDNLGDRLTTLPWALAVAEEAGDLEQALFHRFFWVTTLLEKGDLAAADHEIAIYTDRAQALRQPQARWCALLLAAMRAHLDGRLDAATEQAVAFREWGARVGDLNAEQSFAALMGLVLRERGQLGAAIEEIREQGGRFPDGIGWRAGLTTAFCQAGRFDEARRELDCLAAMQFGAADRNSHWLPGLCLAADVCAELGHQAHAEQLSQILGPYEHHYAVASFGTACFGSILRPLGIMATVLSRWDDAVDLLTRAIAAERRIGAAIWIVHAQMHLARALVGRARKGDRARARDIVDEALAAARGIGMAVCIERLVALERSLAGPRERGI